MSRTLSTDFLNAMAASVIRPALFVEAEVASSTVRFWTGIGDVVWNSATWTGAGSLLDVSPVKESQDTAANGITVTLSGIPSDLISLALQELRSGKRAKVWLGCFDDAGSLIVSPYLTFDGKVDAASFDDDAQTCAITVSAESRLIELEKSPGRNYTVDDHRLDDPTNYYNESFFAFVPQIQDTEIPWGAPGAGQGGQAGTMNGATAEIVKGAVNNLL